MKTLITQFAKKYNAIHTFYGTGDPNQPEVLEHVLAELARGTDFASLTVRFSSGPAAVRGGDIGWIDPEQMVELLRSGIIGLDINEISPPLEAKGVYHLFKRIP